MESQEERAERRLVEISQQIARRNRQDADKWADVLELWLVRPRDYQSRYLEMVWTPEIRTFLEDLSDEKGGA